MMNKLFTEGLLIIIIFFVSLFMINQINWMTFFQVEKKTENLEEELGELFYDFILQDYIEIQDENTLIIIDSIFFRITEQNHIDSDKIQIHIIDNKEVNAFALPGNHLIINTGLMSSTDSPEELAGVICHEIAHIELDHIMKKLVKEVGVSLLVSLAGGNSGSEVLAETVRHLSSSAFDRKLEKEADLKGVDYLINSNIDPNPFADFFYKIEDNDDFIKHFSWLNTHPELKARAQYIVEYINKKEYQSEPIISASSWKILKETTN
ncbi:MULTISPECIES: M48 family metallopeptidase [unclassified Lentimicrobium]|uniref:M48 family metallopeptidase n=1 Tax=unclassified Lentimicrobium TaxID=2677434 RepID=UPI0015556EA5|nr:MULTISPECIES: M48 family metallopeptidase [unclassified Lentimicrobium]NPD45764.1 M48 family metallopeptidase [Lentimicrobium sp. S6]NPD84779.1 M48 family metallopeptidase [Lentimicrobium sp. L6]